MTTTSNDNIFKRKPLLSMLIITTIITLILLMLVEVALRFTPYYGLIRDDIGFPHMFVADNDAGFDLSENFPADTHSTVDIDYKVHSNSIGCYDDEVTLDKDGNYNIIIGDSFTWGFSPLEKKWTTAVETHTQQNFVKCGVPAYGIQQSFLKLKKSIAKIGKTPKNIIFSYYWNDLNDDYTGLNAATVFDGIYINRIKSFNYDDGKIEYLSEEEVTERFRLFKKYGDPDFLTQSTTTKIKLWVKKHSIIANLAHNYLAGINNAKGTPKATTAEGNNARYAHYLAKMSIEEYPWLKPAWKNHLSNIDELVNYAKSIDSNFLLVIIPTKDHIYHLRTSKESIKNIEESRKRLTNHLTQTNVQFVDLYEDFSKASKSTSKGLYLPNDLHWSFEGEALAGKIVSDFIEKEKILSKP